MGIAEIFCISIGLSMDAFAVSVCKGLSMLKMNWKKATIIALYFGIFQAVMPILGFALAKRISNSIMYINYWIAFILLMVIGINMIKEAFNYEEKEDDDVSFKTMCILAIATSIDALAVGVTFAFLSVNISGFVMIVGIITTALSFVGVKIGNKFGKKYKAKAEIFGGITLILISLKLLVENIIIA